VKTSVSSCALCGKVRRNVEEKILCFFEAIGQQYLAGFGRTYFFHPEDGGDMFLRNVG
jgi:hypothetical protein